MKSIYFGGAINLSKWDGMDKEAGVRVCQGCEGKRSICICKLSCEMGKA